MGATAGTSAERAPRVESAVHDLLGGELGEPRRAEAERDAHKLAGSVGMFGLPGGSELARELELGLAKDAVSAQLASRPAEVVLAPQREIARGPVIPQQAAAANREEPRAEADADGGTTILFVSDDVQLAIRLSDEALHRGITIHSAQSGQEACERAQRDRPAAVLIDLGTGEPDPEGLELLGRLGDGGARPAFALGVRETLPDRLALVRRGGWGLPVEHDPARRRAHRAHARAGGQATTHASVLALDDHPTILAAPETLLAPASVAATGLDDPARLPRRVVSTAVGIAMAAVDPGFLALFAVVVYGYGTVLDSITLLLDELSFPRYPRVRDRLLFLPSMSLENVGYRQLRTLWAVRGVWKYLRGKPRVATMTRAGFSGSSDARS